MNALKRGAAAAATVALMGGTALLAGTASAGAATSATYLSTGGYQFASNTGGPGLTGSSDTYFRMSSDPLGYSEASQTLAPDGVDLSADPDTSNYADSGVIVWLGTVGSSGLLSSDGSLSLPAFKGSGNLQVNIYFDTNGDGKYFSFNSDGVYEGADGDTYAISNGQAIPASTVKADENSTLGDSTDIWAWIGIDSTTDGTTVTGNVASVEGQPLTYTDTTTTNTVTNSYSHKCLDVKNANYADGGLLQQWTCGADGGADQHFRIIKGSDGNTYLQAVSSKGAVFNVTSLGAATSDRQLVLQAPWNGTGNQVMVKSGPFYTFPGDSLVMDDAGASTANGAEIIGYPETGGTNQQWSLP